jgi:hypothetical protein
MSSRRSKSNYTSSSSESEDNYKKCSKNRRNMVSDSESDSEAELDSEIRRLQELKEQKENRKYNKKLGCLEEKIEDNKRHDKHVEHKLESKIKKFIKHQKKLKLKYSKIVNSLRKEKCLMVNGSDCYGSFWAYGVQTIVPEASIKYTNAQNVLNMNFVPNTSDITILRSGVYTVHATAQFDQPCQISCFVNGVVDATTITASNSGAHIVTIHQLFIFKAGDVFSIRNHTSNTAITTSIPASGTASPSQNVDLSLVRIAPYPDPCCAPPVPNDKAWCDFESDSDSDWLYSDCEKKHKDVSCNDVSYNDVSCNDLSWNDVSCNEVKHCDKKNKHKEEKKKHCHSKCK